MPVGIFIRTKEHCDNISRAKKGKKQKPQCGFQKGHSQSNTGKTHFKKGEIGHWSGKKRPNVSGENHYRYNGNLTKDHRDRTCKKYHVWRKAVYKRDNCICRMCFAECSNEMMVAHHIKPFEDFPELRFNVENGITLCRACHVKLHNIWGFKKKNNLIMISGGYDD